MKIKIVLPVALTLVLACLPQATQAATNALPLNAVIPLSETGPRGFEIRSRQAPTNFPAANNIVRAMKQLNGTIVDSNGVAVANEAFPGNGTNGNHTVEIINFELAAEPFTIYTPTLFPGIPGTNGSTENFTVQVIAYIDLPAGVTTFGVNVGADRTDVNDDDSYAVFVGANPLNLFNLQVGEFDRNAPPFESNAHNDNQWSVEAPVAGIYPFRLIYWQTGHGANLQWYTVDPNSLETVLVNDANDPRAAAAYRSASSAKANSAAILEVTPLPNSAGNASSDPVHILLKNGASPVTISSIRLTLNGAAVTPQSIISTNGNIAIQYEPNATRQNPTNAMTLVYRDGTGASYTNSWTFEIKIQGGASTQVTGQWDFEAANLAATVGKPLSFFDGPDGLTAQGTLFATTTDFGIADINGEPAKVMYVPGDQSRQIGYIMDHGIKPNGGGLRVNQFTLIMDVMVGSSGASAASMLQISSTNNTDDGDLFWQGDNFGQGMGGYNGTGQFTGGEWHRIVAAYDMAATPRVVTKFVDGIKQHDWTANHGLDNPRRALLPTALLFADGNDDERREWWVNSIQIRSGKLSDAEMVALGGPTASGIPMVILPPTIEPSLTITRAAGEASISWPANVVGFVLESSPGISPAAWTATSGAVNNSVTVPAGGESRFYRLKK